jgi:exodeoxyribonuclease VII small subunit
LLSSYSDYSDRESGSDLTMTSSNATDLSELSFEDAISALEQSVRKLEGNSLGLEQSLNEYAKAATLIAHCQSKLNSAKKKIEQLKSVTRSGTAVTEAWDEPDATEEPKSKRRKPS